MSDSLIQIDRHDKVAVLTLCSPRTRNAITDPEMLRVVCTTLSELDRDAGTSVIILTGEGKGFCSGGNVKDMLEQRHMFSGSALDVQENYRQGIQRLARLMYRLETPTIAAVNGAAAGAGFDLAMLCDFRIGSERACFAATFINLAVAPGDGGAWLLRKTVGAQRAAELVLTGRMLLADEALQWGLLLKQVPHDALIESALTFANSIAEKSPDALRLAKRLLRSTDDLGFEDHLELCAANQALLHRAPEHHEALLKFFDRES